MKEWLIARIAASIWTFVIEVGPFAPELHLLWAVWVEVVSLENGW